MQRRAIDKPQYQIAGIGNVVRIGGYNLARFDTERTWDAVIPRSNIRVTACPVKIRISHCMTSSRLSGEPFNLLLLRVAEPGPDALQHPAVVDEPLILPAHLIRGRGRAIRYPNGRNAAQQSR